MYKRIIAAFISLVLVITVGMQVPIKAVAESIPRYIKEIRMATASSKEEAIAVLEAEGFEVVNRNLREGVSGNVCYLGYKITTDKSEAITDIRLMNAKGGINEKKYRDLVSQWKTGIVSSAEYFKEACLETSENYKKGSPLAVAAVEILDLFEVDGVKLSDYLFSKDRIDTDYQDILLICADNVVTTIYGALNLGTADFGSDTFASRLEKVNFKDFDYSKIAASSGNVDYAVYWENASRVIDRLQEFGVDYDEASDFFAMLEECEDEDETVEPTLPTEEETKEFWKNFVDEKYKNSVDEGEQELYKYANIMGLYEKLKGYSLPNSSYESLADYIYTCGDPFDENGKQNDNIVYRIYPLVSCLTDGQIFTLQYGGVSALVSALDANTEANKNNAVAAIDELKTKVVELGLERISVFYNVNRDIYNQTVAFTNEAERVGTSSSSYSQLISVEEDDEVTKTLTNIILIGGMVSGCILAAAVLIIGFTAGIVGSTMATLVNVGVIALLSGSIGVASGGMTLTAGAIVAGVVGTVMIVVAIVILAIIVICVIIAIIRKIISDSEKEEEVLPDTPNIIFDVVGSKFTEYRAVTDKNGNPVDITNGSGSEWDVMYVSYSSAAGTAISADNEVFKFKTDSNAAPDGYTPVSRLGYIDTANLNSFEGNSKSPLYMFYQGKSRDGDTGAKYLAEMTVAAESTAEAARLKLINEGYIPVEQNITPHTDKVSYIGYKTTDNPNDAITDIRVAYYYSAKSFLFGNRSDGASVEYTRFGELVTKASLYYTRQKSNGSAIIADIKFSKTKLDCDSGYEPVTLFSGGDGYNLMIGCDEDKGLRVMEDDVWNETFYMYFKPSVTFSSSDPEYISGFAFSSGYYDNLAFAAQNGFKVVESLSNHNLTKGATECPTYILYSTTHNPYRAITEICTYNPSNASDSLFENLAVGGIGYAACETFACVCDEGFFTDDYYRMLRPSNSFIPRQTYEGAAFFDLNTSLTAVNNFGTYENTPVKGLYVAGPNSAKQPLTMDDICFITDKDTAGRTAFVNGQGETVFCKPVKDISDCYSTVADNLTFEWDYEIRTSHDDFETFLYEDIVFENYLRIFYRGSNLKRGKYVSAIRVATVEPEKDEEKKYAADQAILKLLSYGEGEIVKVNLARSSSSQPVTDGTITIDGETFDIKNYRSKSGTATYIMIQYTDYFMDSIRTATMKWYSDENAEPTKKLTYQKVSFELTGDKVKGISGDYAIYTSKNGQLGSAVTDLLLDGDYLKNGYNTVSDSDGVCHTGEDYTVKLKQVEDSTAQSYIKNLCVASCSSRQDCIIDLYKRGCTAFIDQDKNSGIGGSCVYIGYSTTVNADDTDIIRGIEIASKSSSSHDSTYTGSDGRVYECISGDLNKGVGGAYTYLYVSKTKTADPITHISTTTIMSSSLSKYTEYKTHDWVATVNAADGTNGFYKLCYKQKSSYWSVSAYGVLYIDLVGDMKNYTDSMSILMVKPGAVGGYRTTVKYYPEWSDYGDAITSVSVGSSVTSIDDCAFRGCPNIELVTVYNKTCSIQKGAIPEGSAIRGYDNSTAYDYAIENGIKFVYFQRINGTVIGNANVTVAVVITVALIGVGTGALVIKKKKKRTRVKEEAK